MAAKKNRPRVSTKRAADRGLQEPWGKPMADFTGKGDEYITGPDSNDGILHFIDGQCRGMNLPVRWRRWNHEDTARGLRFAGENGSPVESYQSVNPVEAVPALALESLANPDLAILAITLIEAIHGGDAEAIRRVAAIASNPRNDRPTIQSYVIKSGDGSPSRPFGSTKTLVSDAVMEAATLAEGVPTREEVSAILSRVFFADGTGRVPELRSDKLQKMLEEIGFGWLPHRTIGEHLKRQSP